MIKRCLVPLLLSACLGLTICPSLPAQAQNAEPDRKALDRLKSRISSTQQQLDRQRHDARREERALREAEVAIGRLSRQITDIEARIRDENRKLEALRRERRELQQARQQQESLLGAQLREAWKLGREQRLRVLFHQEKPENLARSLAWYRYFNEARQAQIQRYRDTLARLDAIEPEILATAARLAETREDLFKQQKALAEHQAERQKVLATLQTGIRDTRAELAQMERQQKALETLLRTVEESITALALPADAVPFAQARGRLPWPAQGQMLHRFGQPRGSGQTWQGVLIQARAGSPVQAIHRGRVVFADWFRGLGLLIIVDHGDDSLSLYAHNQSLMKDIGDWVGAGDTIATVGNSGGQTETGVYFEIRRKGKPQNPAQWCRRFG